jgi:SAM-dependent methyltransferase
MKTRTDLLNHLADKYNLQRYLEIGVQVPELNFEKIKCAYKIGVDPDPKAEATICKTSDEYFEVELNLNEQFPDTQKRYDLIFIDGLHTAEQVKKDFGNALRILSPNGFIVLHDCNPEKEEHTIVPRPKERGHWNGDVYKFAEGINGTKYCVDIDNGCMIIPYQRYIEWVGPDQGCDNWDYFDKNRKRLLNLISWDEFLNLNS